jgi:hypothetical protein
MAREVQDKEREGEREREELCAERKKERKTDRQTDRTTERKDILELNLNQGNSSEDVLSPIASPIAL